MYANQNRLLQCDVVYSRPVVPKHFRQWAKTISREVFRATWENFFKKPSKPVFMHVKQLSTNAAVNIYTM